MTQYLERNEKGKDYERTNDCMKNKQRCYRSTLGIDSFNSFISISLHSPEL